MRSLPNETLRVSDRKPPAYELTEQIPLSNPLIGVSPRIIHIPTPSVVPAGKTEGVWYLMRVAYGREEIARKVLEEEGIETFLPTIARVRLRNGKKRRVIESLIPNLLFVKSTEKELKKYIGQPPLEFLHHYYVPNKDSSGNPIGKKGIKPLIIPDNQMVQFQRWHNVDDDNKLFLTENASKIKEGNKVRIIQGKFSGIMGFVCRVKQQSRVGIHIKGLGTVITAYIPKAFLQPID